MDCRRTQDADAKSRFRFTFSLLGAVLVGFIGMVTFRNRGARARGDAAMNGVPSSTYFTVSPEWGWLITLYFFGGLAGGAYFLAALIDFFGQPEDRPLARLGYYISFPCIIMSGFLLVIDLYRPLRFWHMLIASNTFQPMFKYWSPMSVGSWALLIFGIFSFLSFLGALAESDRLRWSAAGRLRPPGTIKVIAIVGGLCGFYVAGYTGVLLAVTNRPIWSDTPLLGMLLLYRPHRHRRH